MRCLGGYVKEGQVVRVYLWDVQVVYQGLEVRIWMFWQRFGLEVCVWGCEFLSDIKVMNIFDYIQRKVVEG